MKSVILEAAAVALVGTLLSFAANSLSPRGLKIPRDYFPVQSRATNTVTQPTPGTNKLTSTEILSQRVRELGLKLIDSTKAAQLFHEPDYALGQIVFIDARDNEHYEKGHIPGAFQLDYYHPEEDLQQVLPVCQIARQIVLYCNGGDCDDSLLAAVFLRDSAQVPADKMAIYGGGFAEWSTNALPVELGSRLSGILQNPQPKEAR